MLGMNAELIAVQRQFDELAAVTVQAIENCARLRLERDAALAVIAGVAAVIAKLAEHIDNPEDISEYWREAFDATDDIEDILSKAAK